MLEIVEMPLDDQLREAIAESGISASQLAKILGVSQPTVSRFIAGADIRLSMANKMAAYFGLHLAPEASPEEPKPTKKAPRK